MSAPTSSPKVSTKEDDSTWIVITLTTGRDCYAPLHPSPGPIPDRGQSGHWRIDHPALPHQGRWCQNLDISLLGRHVTGDDDLAAENGTSLKQRRSVKDKTDMGCRVVMFCLCPCCVMGYVSDPPLRTKANLP